MIDAANYQRICDRIDWNRFADPFKNSLSMADYQEHKAEILNQLVAMYTELD